MFTVNGQDGVAGCYIAGHHGQYGIDEMVGVCEQYDIEVPDEINPVIWRAVADAETKDDAYGPDGKLYSRDDAWDRHVDSADALEARLNDVTHGGYWTWQDGEFFLVQTEASGWMYVIAPDYEEAWELLRTNTEGAMYADRYQACELAEDGEEGDKVYQFAATYTYVPEGSAEEWTPWEIAMGHDN